MSAAVRRLLRATGVACALLCAALAAADPLPPHPPTPRLAQGTVLSDNGADWLVWIGGATGPEWPLSELPQQAAHLAEFVPPDVVATPDRVVPLFDVQGYAVPVGQWVSGTHAPYDAASFDVWVAEEPSRLDEERRRIRYGRPPPSRTRMIYDALGSGAEAGGDFDESNPEPGPANAYFVRAFEVDDPERFAALQMELEFAAGAVVFLNGREIARHHMPPGVDRHGVTARPYWLADHINQTMYRRWQMTWLGIDASLLRPGTNVLAVAVYKRATGGRRALYFDLRLEGHTAPDFLKTPYLQRVQQDAITVMWETTVAGYPYVEFGTEPDRLDRVATTAQIMGAHHEVVLTGLEPDTRYYYRARTATTAGAEVSSDVRSFRTAVPPGTPFSFLAYGDNRTNPQVHAPLIERMWHDAVAADAGFVLSTGDLVTNASPWREWQHEFFVPALPLMGHFAYYTSLGNHEGNHESYYHYLELPGNEAWYSFRYGDAEFFALNSSAAYEPGSPQHSWLDRALGESDAAWKVVFFHHPPYACTPSRKPGDLGVQAHIVPLLERHGVRLALLGHDHLYGRSREINGVTYVITGGGGAPPYPSAPDEINEICRTEYHYCMVHVSAEQISLRAVSIHGEEIDRFTLWR